MKQMLALLLLVNATTANESSASTHIPTNNTQATHALPGYLHEVVASGNMEALEKHIKEGGTLVFESGYSALRHACLVNNPHVVERVLRAGVAARDGMIPVSHSSLTVASVNPNGPRKKLCMALLLNAGAGHSKFSFSEIWDLIQNLSNEDKVMQIPGIQCINAMRTALANIQDPQLKAFVLSHNPTVANMLFTSIIPPLRDFALFFFDRSGGLLPAGHPWRLHAQFGVLPYKRELDLATQEKRITAALNTTAPATTAAATTAPHHAMLPAATIHLINKYVGMQMSFDVTDDLTLCGGQTVEKLWAELAKTENNL
jgi:hypothetical protein